MRKTLLSNLEDLKKSCEEVILYEEEHKHNKDDLIRYYKSALQELGSASDVVVDRLNEIDKKNRYVKGE